MSQQFNLAPKASSSEDELADQLITNLSDLSATSNNHNGTSPTQRLRASSSASISSNADTRRRISKLKERGKERTRLVEYFCVVSSLPDVQASPSTRTVVAVRPAVDCTKDNGAEHKDVSSLELDGSEFSPQITSRYPLQDHPENPLPVEGITSFCYPSGIVPLLREERMPKVHYFVTTGEKGTSMYGICLVFWEKMEVDVVVADKKRLKSKEEKAMEAPIYNKSDYLSPMNKMNSTSNTKDVLHGNNATTQQVYLPKCLVLLSMYPYLPAFREYLTQLHRLSKISPATDNSNSNTDKSMTLPIERYITNFCSEIPAPPPASFQVQTTILDSVISIWSPEHNMPIQWVSLPFSHLFQCLDIQNVLTVWTALALERQVLITSTQLSLLTTCCEIFLSLLFPMKWTHAYIPVLPHFLVPILSAPMPFLCGIDKQYLAHTLEDLSGECIVVDLDKNQVSLGVKTPPLPSLPKHIHKVLYEKLEENAGCVYREVRSLRKSDNTSEMGFYLDPEVKSMADAMWESRLCLFDEAFMLTFTPEERRKNPLNGEDILTTNEEVRIMTLREKQERLCSQSMWDAVQETFLETYCFLLKNYRKYLVFPSKNGGGSGGAYGGGFRSSEFLASQRADVREFLDELVGSQMFDDFVTKRLYGSGSFDISFFDSAVDRYVKNQSLIATAGNIRNRFLGGPTSSGKDSALPREPPLLQSARVKRKLKTIVPPEPCGIDLPESIENTNVQTPSPDLPDEGEDNSSRTDNNSYRSSAPSDIILNVATDAASVTSARAAPDAGSSNMGPTYYTYPTFPEQLNPALFGTPRPMSSAVMAEYDRQREKVGKFRRASTSVEEADNSSAANLRRSAAAVTGRLAPSEKPATSEVTTFTVFFMAFTALLGRDLASVDDDSLDRLDSKSILSSYKQKDDESKHIANLVDEIVMLGVDDDSSETQKKQSRRHPQKFNTPPRARFSDKLSTLTIMEARETAKAELGIAFEMLRMMKERGLRADPEAYECLIDACGRCGDTSRATQLLSRMHDDGIVADGVVYSSLIAAFSVQNTWKRVSGEFQEELPEWANGASMSMDMDWNTLKVSKRSYIDIVKEKLGGNDQNVSSEAQPNRLGNRLNRLVSRKRANPGGKSGNTQHKNNNYNAQYVTDHVLRQILLGENLLEIVYPDISIDTDNELCPRCNYYLSDDDVVAGWTPGNIQEYKTQCPNCLTNFVPHFCVQSTLPTFVGSKGPSSPLMCERLSPWVLKKELRSIISGGIENLLSPDWRDEEVKNSVVWWNLILSFMRFRMPFTFMLQGSFSSTLIAPTPDDDMRDKP